jgi:hypothetical protein
MHPIVSSCDNNILEPSDENIREFFNNIINDLNCNITKEWEKYKNIVYFLMEQTEENMIEYFIDFKGYLNPEKLIEIKKYSLKADTGYLSSRQRPTEFKFCFYLWLYIHH